MDFHSWIWLVNWRKYGFQSKIKTKIPKREDPDEAHRHEPYHLDLHCLHRYCFGLLCWFFWRYNVITYYIRKQRNNNHETRAPKEEEMSDKQLPNKTASSTHLCLVDSYLLLWTGVCVAEGFSSLFFIIIIYICCGGHIGVLIETIFATLIYKSLCQSRFSVWRSTGRLNTSYQISSRLVYQFRRRNANTFSDGGHGRHPWFPIAKISVICDLQDIPILSIKLRINWRFC